jgi:hypothetical protein
MSDLKSFTRGEDQGSKNSASSSVAAELKKLFQSGSTNDYKVLKSVSPILCVNQKNSNSSCLIVIAVVICLRTS